MTVAVIIVAAGRGTRMGLELPKQYLPLGDDTSLRRAMDAFLKTEAVQWVVPVIHPEDATLYQAALGGLTDPRLSAPVEGGATRALSVRNGLESLETAQPDRVLIHDAARPFVSRRIIEDVIAALDHSDGACAALPVVDALWTSDGRLAEAAVPRDGLWRAQTPQGFRYPGILNAHRTHDGSGADDVAVAREAGLQVRFVLGSERNYKITTHADYDRAQRDIVTFPSD